MVDDFVSVAGDFHGTAEGVIACTLQQLLAFGCAPATIQQTVGSNYLAALNKYGNMALVDTTSIYTYYVSHGCLWHDNIFFENGLYHRFFSFLG
jgi:hypothetical protein